MAVDIRFFTHAVTGRSFYVNIEQITHFFETEVSTDPCLATAPGVVQIVFSGGRQVGVMETLEEVYEGMATDDESDSRTTYTNYAYEVMENLRRIAECAEALR